MLNKFKKFISNLFNEEEAVSEVVSEIAKDIVEKVSETVEETVEEVIEEDVEPKEASITYTLDEIVSRSYSENIPILAGNQYIINELKARNSEVEVYGFAPNFTLYVKNKEFPNGVLVDASVQKSLLKELSDRKIEIRN